MFNNNLAELCFFYCISPLHAGSGQATGAVDLPIQRERHTAWPHVQSSGVKGAFRHWFYAYQLNRSDQNIASTLTRQVFGSEESADSEGGQAGAVSFSDARLLAFPVRSNVAPFVWITCPSVLDRLNRDLLMISGNSPMDIQSLEPEKGLVIIDSDGYLKKHEKIILEDLCVDVEPSPDSAKSIASIFESLVPRVKRLILVSDNDYTFIVRTATEIQPQIKIKMDTGTTQDGSLRYQELLPSDSALYSVVFFFDERSDKTPVLGEVIKGHVKDAVSTHIQLGGDASLGRGLMEISWKSAPEILGGGK